MILVMGNFCGCDFGFENFFVGMRFFVGVGFFFQLDVGSNFVLQNLKS